MYAVRADWACILGICAPAVVLLLGKPELTHATQSLGKEALRGCKAYRDLGLGAYCAVPSANRAADGVLFYIGSRTGAS